MKFFRDRRLKQQTAYLLVLIFLVLLLQAVLIVWKVKELEELHYHGGYARKAQLAFQQIHLNTRQYLDGKDDLASQLVADLDHQDYMHNIVDEGGRIEGTTVFLEPLPELPQISFNELNKHWNTYKQHILRMIATEGRDHSSQIKVVSGQYVSILSWYDKLIVDLDEALERERLSLYTLLIVILLIDVFVGWLIYRLFNKSVLLPLESVKQNTGLHRHTRGLPSNEIGMLAEQVNDVIEQLKDASDFVQHIGKGKLDIRYQELDPNYSPGKNILADSLIDMQEKLREMGEEERKRKWANEGLTKFVDILRSGGDDLHVLGDKIVSALVQYTGSNQGALYLLNDEGGSYKYLELISKFAFDIKKHETQKIVLGEGLVGQTVLEKETTYVTNIPDEYVRITSGLGGDKPKSLLMVPLKIDQDVYGVVELASFSVYEPYVIAFVERLGETIASTLSNVKASQRNRRLLEESKEAEEMMRAQEEEMRQNMEELSATQEEIARKERNYIEKIQELEAQLQQASSAGDELTKLRSELARLEEANATRIRELEEQLSGQPTHGDDWAVASELEKALRINLEALKITREELGKHKS